jgi:hypothetical protein
MRIGLSAWIVQDGNYRDFAVGDVRPFALEFYAEKFSVKSSGSIGMKHLKDCIYEIEAQVIFKKAKLTIIDFGYRAYTEGKIDAKAGDWIKGEVGIGIDPFFYFESWERDPEVPKIKSKWRVDRIFMDTTPLVEFESKNFRRDEARFSEIEIQMTNAWNDDSGNGSYALYCTRMGDA